MIQRSKTFTVCLEQQVWVKVKHTVPVGMRHNVNGKDYKEFQQQKYMDIKAE